MMFVDIVKPEGNEAELILMGKRLGLGGLAFLDVSKNNVAEMQKKTDLRLLSAGKGNVDILVKKVGDVGKADIVFGVEDHMKHSFYKELSLKKTAICFPLSEIIGGHEHLIEVFSRNIRLCREHDVRIVAATFARDPYQMRSEQDIRALLSTLGMSTSQLRDAFSLIR